ncbi:MAG: hypothetical protein JO283_15040 [Bradyrhizobium sp.]|nr:hypothetical protein [Bradyrhizobium sp.]
MNCYPFRLRFPTNLMVKCALMAALSFSAARADVGDPVEGEAGGIAFAATQARYYWHATPVGDSAQLLTLFCQVSDHDGDSATPLVAVLRDTLPDANPDNDRLTYVWLFTYQQANVGQRLLSAVPFFYWRPGRGSGTVKDQDISPLLDLTSEQRPMVTRAGRDLFQWTVLDPGLMPIRASSRAYRANETDHLRLHLEEAISYLRDAPAGNGQSALTRNELQTVIARLELRKQLLGGFVDERGAKRYGEEDNYRYERVRSRNWELLRQCAEKTGLYFEQLDLAGTEGEYAILWLSLDDATPAPPESRELSAVWKILAVKDPRKDPTFAPAHAKTYVRYISENGALLPDGVLGAKAIRLVPLSVYSLNYPKVPLLLVDFFDRSHVRRHEMLQRSINEITAGIVGLSHFANWYYFVAADLYDFFVERHGAAMNEAERLDCYSQFRVKLELDRQMDPKLRSEMQTRVDSLALNPLEVAPEREMEAARARYNLLINQAGEGGKLARRLNNDRRKELAFFGQSRKRMFVETVLHDATLGKYTHRASEENLATLDRDRRLGADLSFLDSVTENGTQPEVTFEASRIERSVTELGELMQTTNSPALRSHAAATLNRVRALSADPALRAGCSQALVFAQNTRRSPPEGITAKPSAVKIPQLGSAAALKGSLNGLE